MGTSWMKLLSRCKKYRDKSMVTITMEWQYRVEVVLVVLNRSLSKIERKCILYDLRWGRMGASMVLYLKETVLILQTSNTCSYTSETVRLSQYIPHQQQSMACISCVQTVTKLTHQTQLNCQQETNTSIKKNRNGHRIDWRLTKPTTGLLCYALCNNKLYVTLLNNIHTYSKYYQTLFTVWWKSLCSVALCLSLHQELIQNLVLTSVVTVALLPVLFICNIIINTNYASVGGATEAYGRRFVYVCICMSVCLSAGFLVAHWKLSIETNNTSKSRYLLGNEL